MLTPFFETEYHECDNHFHPCPKAWRESTHLYAVRTAVLRCTYCQSEGDVSQRATCHVFISQRGEIASLQNAIIKCQTTRFKETWSWYGNTLYLLGFSCALWCGCGDLLRLLWWWLWCYVSIAQSRHAMWKHNFRLRHVSISQKTYMNYSPSPSRIHIDKRTHEALSSHLLPVFFWNCCAKAAIPTALVKGPARKQVKSYQRLLIARVFTDEDKMLYCVHFSTYTICTCRLVLWGLASSAPLGVELVLSIGRFNQLKVVILAIRHWKGTCSRDRKCPTKQVLLKLGIM